MQKPILGYGLCECGCGCATTVAARTQTAFGHIKGKPLRFILGHKPGDGPVVFWERIQSIQKDGCWEWEWSRSIDKSWPDSPGYGVFGGIKVHRAMYEHAHGPIPDDMFVLHRCDNPPCCNPAHLFVGTHRDNMDDKIRKRRAPRWVWPDRTDADVQRMITRHLAGESYPRLASEIGVEFHALYQIVRRFAKKHNLAF